MFWKRHLLRKRQERRHQKKNVLPCCLLKGCARFNLVVRNCFVSIEHKRQFQKGLSASHPDSSSRHWICSGQCFLLRPTTETHIGAAVWQSCQQLQLVKLPTTVVCIKEGAFQGCYALTQVVAPGVWILVVESLQNVARFGTSGSMKERPMNLRGSPNFPICL